MNATRITLEGMKAVAKGRGLIFEWRRTPPRFSLTSRDSGRLLTTDELAQVAAWLRGNPTAVDGRCMSGAGVDIRDAPGVSRTASLLSRIHE